MKTFIDDLKAFLESVIIALVVTVPIYYLFLYVLKNSDVHFTVDEARDFAFVIALISGTVLAITGMLEHFKKDSKAAHHS